MAMGDLRACGSPGWGIFDNIDGISARFLQQHASLVTPSIFSLDFRSMPRIGISVRSTSYRTCRHAPMVSRLIAPLDISREPLQMQSMTETSAAWTNLTRNMSRTRKALFRRRRLSMPCSLTSLRRAWPTADLVKLFNAMLDARRTMPQRQLIDTPDTASALNIRRKAS